MNILGAIMWICPQAKWHFEGEQTDGSWTYDNLVWDDAFFPKPTLETLQAADNYSRLSIEIGTDYRLQRKQHYPTADQQLAMIYDIGIDGWKARIDEVKAKYPKPV